MNCSYIRVYISTSTMYEDVRQQIKWAGNGDGSNSGLGGLVTAWTTPRGYFQIVIIQSNMEPHHQIKWAGNGDGSNSGLDGLVRA